MRLLTTPRALLPIGLVLGAVLYGGFTLLTMAHEAFGTAGVVGALVLSPILIPVIPLVAGFTKGSWTPALVVYGLLAASGVLLKLVEAIVEKTTT